VIKFIAIVAVWFFPIGTILSIYLWFAYIKNEDSPEGKQIKVKGGFNDRINEKLATKINHDENEEKSRLSEIELRQEKLEAKVNSLCEHLGALTKQINKSYPWCDVESFYGENMMRSYGYQFTIKGSFQHDLGTFLVAPFIIRVSESDLSSSGYSCELIYFNGCMIKMESNTDTFKLTIDDNETHFVDVDHHIETFFVTVISSLKSIGYRIN